MSQIIDARGKACPTPVILAKGAITAGETAFSIQVDNPIAVENLKRLAGNQGFSLQIREEEDCFSVAFSRRDAPHTEQEPRPAALADCAIFVGRDTIGDGDRELGINLMRMFFYTLAQSEQPPRRILFMNAGVKLPALEGQVVEHLHTLAGRGVEILVCGTCLDFYHLAGQLQAGTVSNMYDIVSAMEGAAKVITL